jgi:hypothetical protein
MSHYLDCGFSLRRVPAPHIVNGREVGYLADPIDRELVITDDGDPDALMERTAEALMVAISASKKVEGYGADGIELLTGKQPKCPLVPGTQPPSLFSQRPEV